MMHICYHMLAIFPLTVIFWDQTISHRLCPLTGWIGTAHPLTPAEKKLLLKFACASSTRTCTRTSQWSYGTGLCQWFSCWCPSILSGLNPRCWVITGQQCWQTINLRLLYARGFGAFETSVAGTLEWFDCYFWTSSEREDVLIILLQCLTLVMEVMLTC